MHLGMRGEPGAWIFAVIMAGFTGLHGTLIVYETLHNMELPKIAALDLRDSTETELDRFLARRARTRPAVFEPFPSGWHASS